MVSDKHWAEMTVAQRKQLEAEAEAQKSPAVVVDYTNDELRQLARDRLVAILLDQDERTSTVLGAVKELLDRVDGKPVQSIAAAHRNEGAAENNLLAWLATIEHTE